MKILLNLKIAYNIILLLLIMLRTACNIYTTTIYVLPLILTIISLFNILCRKKRRSKATINGKEVALPMKVVHTDPQEQVEWIENGGEKSTDEKETVATSENVVESGEEEKSTGEKETVATSENGAAAVAAEDAEDYFEDISAVGIYYSNSVT